MLTPDRIHLRGEPASARDALALFAEAVENAIREENYPAAARLVETDIASAWFGIQSARLTEILHLFVTKNVTPCPLLKVAHQVLTTSTAGQLSSRELLASIDLNDPQQMFVLTLFRRADFRLKGRTIEALEQGDSLQEHLVRMNPLLDRTRGAHLQAAVQIGISAMLAGDFTKALTAFTQAQMQPAPPQYAFLTRDALVKSALIHACFGNATTAKALLDRSVRIRRTSSWIEAHIDTHQEFVRILIHSGSDDEALDQLEAINLHDIGEMWPFYMVASHRVLEATGRQDELELQLNIFDSLPLARVDGDGFSGSIIPLNRALVALSRGREAEADTFLSRTDPHLPYTKLVQSAAHLYSGQNQQAIQKATRLRHQTRGFRLMEVRRLSILATAHYRTGNVERSIETLKHAAQLPRGLSPTEIELFNADCRELAAQHVTPWPSKTPSHTTFLTGLPEAGRTLTEREIVILRHLAEGHTRARIAEILFISLSTVKTQLRSAFRKLGVSSTSDAIVECQRRDLI
ncbi:MAG: helix-turn-helix domain-containing protein [Micrococcaceae bacterium]|nr:helix-turn-helix domain-containing protein [Micrococcaceae bacterium]